VFKYTQGVALGYNLLAFQAVCRIIADNHIPFYVLYLQIRLNEAAESARQYLLAASGN
jgi:hypothetical protein